MTEGQITFRWTDHEETYVAGDAYYAPPGHLPLMTAGTSIVEFSPTADLEPTMAVVQKNLTRVGVRHEPALRRRRSARRPDPNAAVARLIGFLETGTAPDGLFAPDVFADLSLPQWRIQTDAPPTSSPSGPTATPYPGQVRVERVEADRPRASPSNSRNAGTTRASGGTAAR